MTDYTHGEYEISDSQKKYYTPTTEEVRDRSIWLSEKAFDRWLAEVKAQAVHDFVESAIKPEKIMEVAAAGYNESVREVMAQAWQEGCLWASDDYSDGFEMYNPYRRGETE